jgi:hypothetical protein
LPAPLPAEPLVGVWLFDGPVTLAAGETLEITVTGETTVPMRFSASPFGATRPLEVAPAALTAALTAKKPGAAQRDLLVDTWLLSTADDRAGFDRFQKLAGALRELRDGRAWSLITQAVAEPLPVRVLPRGNWQDESGPVVLPATPSRFSRRGRASTPEHRLTRLDLARGSSRKKTRSPPAP